MGEVSGARRDWARLTAVALLGAVNPLVAWAYVLRLRSRGIDAKLAGPIAVGFPAGEADAQVLVAPDDLDRARAVLDAPERGTESAEERSARILADTVSVFEPDVLLERDSAARIQLWLEGAGIPSLPLEHPDDAGGPTRWSLRVHRADADAAHEAVTDLVRSHDVQLPELHFEPTPGWALVHATPDTELARAEAILAAEEIPHRRKGDRLEVPAELQSDAIAVRAAREPTAEPLPADRARELAELTASVTNDPLMPWPAGELALRLHAAGIRATTDMPGQGLGFALEVSASCRVLVHPDDLERARAAAAERPGDEGATRDQVRHATASLFQDDRTLPGALARPLDGMLHAAAIRSYWWPVESAEAAEAGRSWEVRVAPADLVEAQACVQRLGQAIHDTHAPPAPDKPLDPDDAKPIIPASLVLFLVLVGVVYLLMKSCR